MKKDIESELLSAMASLKKQGKEPGPFMILRDRDRFRVAIRSTREPVITFGDWTVATISPRDLEIVAKMSKTVLDHLEKETKQEDA